MSICPICNGLTLFQRSCPKCSGQLTDVGRIYDYYADYSPYREIDDLKMTNGYDDFEHHQCMHLAYCPTCNYEDVIAVREE